MVENVLLENENYKKHKMIALPSERSSEKSKESEIGKIWSQLATGMEEEVLSRYKVE